MTNRFLTSLFSILVLAATWAAPAPGQESAVRLASKQCLGCHDLGPDSPPHYLMEGSHGGDVGGSGNVRGCPACHGPSENHLADPTQNSPDVSFGPRWGAGAAAQDTACLACHEENTAVHWRHALHMLNNVTCITCHDIHAEGDKVLFPDRQAGVCTICHKAQKAGIHGNENPGGLDPACSDCHNPHDHESAKSQMLKNDSLGCRSCHDLARMAESDTVSDSAVNYHRVMSQPNRTCVECHKGIAHVAADAVTAFLPTAVNSGRVTLFYPGGADSEWLLHNHPGSQPLRQGAGCRQCHRGEEANLGHSRAGHFEPAYRDVQVDFDGDEDSIRMVLQWRGERDETDIALMWGKRSSGPAFSRGGCFAACHSDLPGMSRDRGQQTGKYLPASRSQQRSLGKPAIVKDATSLDQMMAEGQFAVLWRINLNTGIAEAATVLDDVHWQPAPPIRASTSYRNGRWTVKIRRRLTHQPEHLMHFDPDTAFTFGIALHGADNPGAGHWVSLPLSFSYRGEDTDFRVD